ncbi:MAG: OmpA family protein [Alphaproteobacteria bacterium]|nr:OmpA family protein [Alphaproteobacteria bacterium]
MADNQTIIIKRIKKGGHGAHGGAWKVAYADFVTAMMAFFLLLWLLSSTSEAQKEGIAEYFAPTVGLKDSEGIGFEGGESASAEGVKKSDMAPVGIVYGAPTVGELQNDASKISDYDATAESKAFEEIKEAIEQAIEQELKEYAENIVVKETPEGLKIEVVDLDKVSMFERGSAKLMPPARLILEKLKDIVMKAPNNISMEGHTDATQYGSYATYTNWELSADRANTSRRFMVEKGLPTTRIARVTGYSDRDPLDGGDPKSARNRRISVLLLKQSISPIQQNATGAAAAEANLPMPPGGDAATSGAPTQAITVAPAAPGAPAIPVVPVAPGTPGAIPVVPLAPQAPAEPRAPSEIQAPQVRPSTLAPSVEQQLDLKRDPSQDLHITEQPSGSSTTVPLEPKATPEEKPAPKEEPQEPAVKNLDDPNQFGVF